MLPPGGPGGDPSRDGYCCGRYASYWNAFLLKTAKDHCISIQPGRKKKLQGQSVQRLNTKFHENIFYFSQGEESKTVRQFHFTAWPDHGVPPYATSLLAFHRKVRSFDDPTAGPTITHCRSVTPPSPTAGQSHHHHPLQVSHTTITHCRSVTPLSLTAGQSHHHHPLQVSLTTISHCRSVTSSSPTAGHSNHHHPLQVSLTTITSYRSVSPPPPTAGQSHHHQPLQVCHITITHCRSVSPPSPTAKYYKYYTYVSCFFPVRVSVERVP